MEKLEYLDVENLKIYQDDSLYTFTSDSILLSRFASVKKGDIVADFCAGSGIVGFHLYGLNKDLISSIHLFEMQKSLYNLSAKSIEYNGLQDRFFAINSRLQDIDNEYNGKFSLIVCNPPYMKVGHGDINNCDEKALCKSEISLSLDELVKAISKCLKFKGRTAICHRADRLVEVICTLKKYGIEPKRLQFISAKGKEPYLFLIEGVKGGKSRIKVMENIIN